MPVDVPCARGAEVPHISTFAPFAGYLYEYIYICIYIYTYMYIYLYSILRQNITYMERWSVWNL